jgi:hypothetical protein
MAAPKASPPAAGETPPAAGETCAGAAPVGGVAVGCVGVGAGEPTCLVSAASPLASAAPLARAVRALRWTGSELSWVSFMMARTCEGKGEGRG